MLCLDMAVPQSRGSTFSVTISHFPCGVKWLDHRRPALRQCSHSQFSRTEPHPDPEPSQGHCCSFLTANHSPSHFGLHPTPTRILHQSGIKRRGSRSHCLLPESSCILQTWVPLGGTLPYSRSSLAPGSWGHRKGFDFT